MRFNLPAIEREAPPAPVSAIERNAPVPVAPTAEGIPGVVDPSQVPPVGGVKPGTIYQPGLPRSRTAPEARGRPTIGPVVNEQLPMLVDQLQLFMLENPEATSYTGIPQDAFNAVRDNLRERLQAQAPAEAAAPATEAPAPPPAEPPAAAPFAFDKPGPLSPRVRSSSLPTERVREGAQGRLESFYGLIEQGLDLKQAAKMHGPGFHSETLKNGEQAIVVNGADGLPDAWALRGQNGAVNFIERTKGSPPEARDLIVDELARHGVNMDPGGSFSKEGANAFNRQLATEADRQALTDAAMRDPEGFARFVKVVDAHGAEPRSMTVDELRQGINDIRSGDINRESNGSAYWIKKAALRLARKGELDAALAGDTIDHDVLAGPGRHDIRQRTNAGGGGSPPPRGPGPGDGTGQDAGPGGGERGPAGDVGGSAEAETVTPAAPAAPPPAEAPIAAPAPAPPAEAPAAIEGEEAYKGFSLRPSPGGGFDILDASGVERANVGTVQSGQRWVDQAGEGPVSPAMFDGEGSLTRMRERAKKNRGQAFDLGSAAAEGAGVFRIWPSTGPR
jgi:hypothetical protein